MQERIVRRQNDPNSTSSDRQDRSWLKTWGIRLAVGAAAGACSLAIAGIGCAVGLKDIRPDNMQTMTSDEGRVKAQALLERAVKNAGGRDLLQTHAGFHTKMKDVWSNPMAKFMFLRYDAEQQLDIVAKNPRVDHVQMRLVSGDRAGEVWGIEDNRVYTDDGSGRTFTDDELTMLYVKNPAALVLLPLRMGWADKVTYLGTRTHDGVTYDAVFATWNTFEPNQEFDQWVLWFDRETGNIAKAQFTIREYTGALVDEAAVELSDYKRHGDVLVPTTISALFALDGDSVRTWTVESFEWLDENAFPASPSQTGGAASQPAG